MVLTSRFAAAAAAAVLVALLPSTGQSQQRRAQVGRFEVEGMDFSPDGAWRKRTREIRLQRRNLMQSGAMRALNATGPSATQITGTYNVPVVLISYSNVAAAFPTASYQDVLFNPTPTLRPYSVKTYYEQVSRGNITMNGTVFNAVVTANADTYYEDGCDGIGINQNGQGVTCLNPGLNGTSARFGELLTEVLGLVDNGTVNWGQFDNDGPDALPNSGDDDGFVDFISFIQPEIDGACGTTNIWAHRFTVSGVTGGHYTTTTARTGGGFVRIRDYTMQSGQGGNGACSSGQIMPIGTIAHETGHAFGLPDLYDTGPNQTEGIGEWGIMGSGNYARPYSPALYDAWSLVELGWVTVTPLTTTAVITLNPVQTSDTVLYVAIGSTDEFLLLENRDSLLSDTAQMNSAFGTRKKNPGLLIWHIDQSIVTAGQAFNSVNAGSIQGVALEQADGLNELRSFQGDRGDAGDSYPGSTGNTRYSFTSTPSARDNQGVFDGFAIDSITRNASGVPSVPSPIVFRFTKRAQSLFNTSRNGAVIKVNNVTVTSFNDVVAPGDQIALDVVSPQTITSGRTQLTWLNWSDGGLAAHTVTSSAVQPDTVTANFSANHKVNLVTAPSGGTVTSDIAGSPNLVVGHFGQEGLPITLTATADVSGTFIRYQGTDTTTTNAVLVLPMNRPYSLTAVFSGSVVIVTQDAVNALLGATCAVNPCLDAAELTFMDQSGNNDGVYNLGDFLAYADRSGLNSSSPAMQQLLTKPTISVPLSGPAKQ